MEGGGGEGERGCSKVVTMQCIYHCCEGLKVMGKDDLISVEDLG